MQVSANQIALKFTCCERTLRACCNLGEVKISSFFFISFQKGFLHGHFHNCNPKTHLLQIKTVQFLS